MPIRSFLALLLLSVTAAAGAGRAAPTLEDLVVTPDPAGPAIRVAATIGRGGGGRGTLTLAVGDRRTTARVALPDGGPSATVIEARLALGGAKLWTPERPALYQLRATLEARDRVVARRTVTFALRTVGWRDGRLLLNGVPRPVRGARLAAATGTEAAALEGLRAAGFTVVDVNAAVVPPAVAAWCDVRGLLAVTDVPFPPLDEGPGAAADAVPAWTPEFLRLDLAREFHGATAFVAAARAARAERIRGAIEAARTAVDAPGWLIARPDDPCLAAILPRLQAPVLLILRPAADLVEPDTNVIVSATATGDARLLRDAVLDWRALAPGDDPALPPPWRAGPPRGRDGGWRLPAFPATIRGRWLVQARLRRKGRELAAAAEPVWCEATDPGSQISFALAGESPGIRTAFGSWIIPPAYAPVLVVPAPAALDAAALAGLVRDAAAGKHLVFPGPLAAADLAALARTPGWTLTVTARPAGGRRLALVRAGRFGGRLPGAGPGEPWGMFAGGPLGDFAPAASLAVALGATVYAASVDEAAAAGEAPDLVWGADVMAVPLGRGGAVFSQWPLADRLDRPLGRLLFLRLLAL